MDMMLIFLCRTNWPLCRSWIAGSTLLLLFGLLGCTVDESVIPRSEVEEIRTQAFEQAKKYILTDEDARAAYEGKLTRLLEEVTNKSQAVKNCGSGEDKDFLALTECLLAAGSGPSTEDEARNKARVMAASNLKGIRIVPTSRTECIVLLDFGRGDETISIEPPTRMTFERYETIKGRHYWKIIKWSGG